MSLDDFAMKGIPCRCCLGAGPPGQKHCFGPTLVCQRKGCDQDWHSQRAEPTVCMWHELERGRSAERQALVQLRRKLRVAVYV